MIQDKIQAAKDKAFMEAVKSSEFCSHQSIRVALDTFIAEMGLMPAPYIRADLLETPADEWRR